MYDELKREVEELKRRITALENGDGYDFTNVSVDDETLKQFILERTSGQPNARIRSTVLYEAYCNYCLETGLIVPSITKFGTSMRKTQFKKIQSNGMYYVGLKLK